MICNFYEKDIIGAKHAGMQTVWFNESKNSGQFDRASFRAADQIIFAIESLLDIIPWIWSIFLLRHLPFYSYWFRSRRGLKTIVQKMTAFHR